MEKSLLTKIALASGLGLLTFLGTNEIKKPIENSSFSNKDQTYASSVIYVEETKPQTIEELIADSKYSNMRLDELTQLINEYVKSNN